MRSLILLPCLVLAACGGGASVAAPAGDGGGSQPTGTRAVPGGDIAVQQTAAAAFHLSTTMDGVQSAEALLGGDYATARAVALSPDGAGWNGVAAPGAPLLVRLTLADGSVVETAPGDFTLR